jgi:hypothetical protein
MVLVPLAIIASFVGGGRRLGPHHGCAGCHALVGLPIGGKDRVRRGLSLAENRYQHMSVMAPLRQVICPRRASFAKSCPALSRQNFACAVGQIRGTESGRPVPPRGAYARSPRTLGAGCGGRVDIARRAIQCGRQSRVVLTPRRWCQACG